MKRILSAIIVIFGLTAMFDATFASADPVPVFVSIAPQKYFVQQIGKEWVDVRVMVPPGASPATYEPKPRQMAAFSKTRIYFSIGVPFERVWLKKIRAANPNMQVVPTDQGIEKIHMASRHHDEKDGHPKGSDRGIPDPHIWHSPLLVKTQAQTILKGLQAVDPAHRLDYGRNHKDFMAEIVNLDRDIHNTFAGKHGLRFMVFHPSWGYFAHNYGLRQVPIEMEGKNPKPARLKALIEQARRERIKVVFVQPQFSAKSAKLIAREIGGEVAFVDPLAENWAANLREAAQKFKMALK